MEPPDMQPESLTPDCGRIRNELAAFLYGELPPESTAAVEQHVAGCAACSEELAGLRETRSLLARWETPADGVDPRDLARAIAARARLEAQPRPRRGRLVRWSAMLSGAAAALLFSLSLLNATIRSEGGRLEISFALPGLAPPDGGLGLEEERMRSIAAQEVATRTAGLELRQEDLIQSLARMTRQEQLRLAQAVDLVLAQNQRTWDTRYETLTREAARADLEQRQVINDIARTLVVPASNPNR